MTQLHLIHDQDLEVTGLFYRALFRSALRGREVGLAVHGVPQSHLRSPEKLGKELSAKLRLSGHDAVFLLFDAEGEPFDVAGKQAGAVVTHLQACLNTSRLRMQLLFPATEAAYLLRDEWIALLEPRLTPRPANRPGIRSHRPFPASELASLRDRRRRFARDRSAESYVPKTEFARMSRAVDSAGKQALASLIARDLDTNGLSDTGFPCLDGVQRVIDGWFPIRAGSSAPERP